MDIVFKGLSLIALGIGGAVMLLFAGVCVKAFWEKAVDWVGSVRVKTYRIDYLGFKYQKKIDGEDSLVFPKKNARHVYVRARSQKKAIAGFYAKNWNYGCLVMDIEEAKG